MNLIKRKAFSLLTEAAYNQIEALDSQSPLAKELSKIEDVNTIIAEDIAKICNAATLAELTRSLLLVRRLKKAPVNEKEIIKNELNGIAEKLITRLEIKAEPLKLPKAYMHLFSEI